jgi:threonine dehydrogenase-like Zn-dependent dehydrogenase
MGSYNFPMGLAFMKDLTFKVGLVNVRNNIPHLARLIETGRIDPSLLVSHHLPMGEIPRGYKIFDARTEGALKVLVNP